MHHLIRTNSSHSDFIELVKHLDAELAERDGKDNSFYAQFNKIDLLRHAIVAYENNQPIACGAIKEFAPHIMEVKRMFTIPEYRGKRIARKVLTELENWAAEMSYTKFVLETGKRQPEAIRLYQNCGFPSSLKG